MYKSSKRLRKLNIGVHTCSTQQTRTLLEVHGFPLHVPLPVPYFTIEFVATIQLLSDDEGVCVHDQTIAISLKNP